MKTFILVVALAWASFADAYIYSVKGLVEAAFAGRELDNPLEIVLRHQIGQRSSGQLLREHLYTDGQNVLASWSIEGSNASAKGFVTADAYNLMGQKTYKRESRLFVSYLTSLDPQKFIENAVEERFVRRDQWMECKPGYDLKTSPKTWKPNNYYIRQDDIFLKRMVGEEPAIQVTGTDEGLDKRLLFFDKDLRGLRRIEWREEGRVTAWNFDHFKKFPVGAYFPRRITLSRGDVDVISSEVVAVKSLKGADWDKIKKGYTPATQNISIPSAVEEAFDILLRYR
ncbi:MAG: hypothetical protein KDD39_06270 [Bdellovibrionales bacterium]|nr:hypothetical protein [Bdellovibrionales bacterium]